MAPALMPATSPGDSPAARPIGTMVRLAVNCWWCGHRLNGRLARKRIATPETTVTMTMELVKSSGLARHRC
jgi:hypothetical protein